ncbi:MAG: helix-turn-helix domain-containing protein [Lachnospiraceae bacterium]|nr:helix-turn-helix domain-containing protein [Lachnospiraceae bacterium]
MQNKTTSIIYAYRKLKGLTQEQLADIVGVSPVAVSKWERAISVPNVDVLCKLADCFDITVDELLGRATRAICENHLYTQEILKRLTLGELLIKCCRKSREEGLLAMEQLVQNEKNADGFLCFAVTFLLNNMRKGISIENTFQMLHNYAENESDTKNARMIAEILSYIVAGENEEYIREWMASYMGKEHRNKFVNVMEKGQFTREELLAGYTDKRLKYESTNLLEELVSMSDEAICMLLKNVDSSTLTTALSGASGTICKKVLANFSDRLLYYMNDDIKQCQVTEAEVLTAQKRILMVATNCGAIF